jgi:hypothetical protein
MLLRRYLHRKTGVSGDINNLTMNTQESSMSDDLTDYSDINICDIDNYLHYLITLIILRHVYNEKGL